MRVQYRSQEFRFLLSGCLQFNPGVLFHTIASVLNPPPGQYFDVSLDELFLSHYFVHKIEGIRL